MVDLKVSISHADEDKVANSLLTFLLELIVLNNGLPKSFCKCKIAMDNFPIENIKKHLGFKSKC